MLERGKEYLPGAFPTGVREIPRHVRRKSNKEGLFDIRLGPEVNTVVANGVGGGSLINAGVMEQPLASGVRERVASCVSNLVPTWQDYFDCGARGAGLDDRWSTKHDRATPSMPCRKNSSRSRHSTPRKLSSGRHHGSDEQHREHAATWR